jgi:RHS repeat-associated protein
VTNTYNGFGELTSSTDPQGNVTTIQKYWDVTSGGATPTIPQNTIFYSQVNSTNKPYKKTWFDIFVREVKSELQTQNGATYSVVRFDSKGNNITSTSPFLVGGTAPIITTNTYDVYNRLLSVTNGINATSYAYSAIAGKLKTTVTTPTQTTSQTVDAAGRIVSSTDNGGTLNFTYFSNGEQKSIAMGSTIIVQMEYDQYGRQTKLTDIDAGISTYVYNAYGQLITQTDANNVTYQLQYDALGRETSKTGPDGVTSSTFIATGNGINQTRRITAANGSYFEYLYDDFGRVLSEIKFIDGQTFTTSTQYNIANNVSSITYPSGYKIKMNYSSIGDLLSVTNDGGSVTMYSLPTTNQNGQITSYKSGNNKTTNLSYDAYGMLTNISASGVQNYEVLFNQSTGNLSFRKDYLKDKNELFWYDNLNRLTDCQVKSINTQAQGPIYTSASYSSNGNITNKYNVGDYAYDANKIHAVKQINNPTVAIPSLVQAITYTPFDRTATITEGTSSLTLKYGPDLDRIKSELYSNGNLVKTKYFIGGYEKEVTSTGTKEIHYIPTGNGSNAVYVIDQGVGSYFYLYKDHLGSVVAVTNNTGAVVYEQSFEAWGKRRDPLNWSNTAYVPNPSFSWVRGFTGHEHLDEFGLINMNNRIYDPVLGRMLAVDNFVQNPLLTQNYNRYSYAYNNPLCNTDPNGEFIVSTAVISFLVFTEIGYNVQKAILPLAVHVDLNANTDKRGIGLDVSFGMPQMSPFSARANVGVSFYSKNGNMEGWEGRYGAELGVAGVFFLGSTYYDAEGSKFDQRLGTITIGNPYINAKYANDWQPGLPLGDNGDRYRTAALKLTFGGLSVGFNLFTGDPGLKNRKIDDNLGGLYGQYVKNDFGNDPDEYRSGIGYIGIGPIRIGNDSEKRRDLIQNRIIHDKVGSPHFKVLNRPNKFYFGFFGNGNLW